LRKHKKFRKLAGSPDDYIAAGPYEFARIGNLTIARSRATPSQAAAMQKRMADGFPAVVAELNSLVLSIAEQIAHLPPGQLLQRAWWEFAMTASGLAEQNGPEVDLLAAMRMVDYVQSVIASVQPVTYAEEMIEEDWQRLKADVANLFNILTLRYQLSQTAYRQAMDPNLDMDQEGF